MKNIIKKITEFFEKDSWQYHFYEEDNVFISKINMEGILGVLDILIIVKENNYRVYSILNNKAEKSVYPQVAEFLHKVNYGLINGNFEINFDDGEIRYKTFVNFEASEISQKVIEDSIMLAIFMFNEYGKSLLNVMLNEKSNGQGISDLKNVATSE